MVFCCCVSKGKTMEDAGEAASIRAHSDEGCSSPYFHDKDIPPVLAEAGMTAEAWQALIDEAGTAAKFHWNPYTCIGTWCCCCFTHHKDIKPRMRALVEKLNASNGSLPTGFVARYQMEWERSEGGGVDNGGASVENYHKILFFRMDSGRAPPQAMMEDRKLSTVGR